MDNLYIYNQVRKAPKEALKPITAGDLKGKSDISPQWRIEVMTSVFGPCGIGWYTEFVERWTEEDNEIDSKNGVFIHGLVAWVRINLYVKVDGEWSKPIVGIGGSKMAGVGRGGKLNDEAYKMAETDAISVACKKLGVAADVYWDASTTKYSSYEETPQIKPTKPTKPTTTPTDPFKALKSAKSGEELNTIWAEHPELQNDAKFVTEINKRAAELNK